MSNFNKKQVCVGKCAIKKKIVVFLSRKEGSFICGNVTDFSIFSGSRKIGELGNYREDCLFLWSLCRYLWDQNFPNGVFCLWKFPRKRGRKGSAKRVAAIFAKTCFEASVGVWSVQTGKTTCFLIAFLAFWGTELSAHNPEHKKWVAVYTRTGCSLPPMDSSPG